MSWAHILVAEHTWAQDEDSHGDSGWTSRKSLHGDVGARVEAEALEAVGALDSAVGVHVTRRLLQVDSYDTPWPDARFLEHALAGMQLVALGLLKYARGVKNEPSIACSRAPEWLGRNGRVVLFVMSTLWRFSGCVRLPERCYVVRLLFRLDRWRIVLLDEWNRRWWWWWWWRSVGVLLLKLLWWGLLVRKVGTWNAAAATAAADVAVGRAAVIVTKGEVGGGW